MTATLVDRNTQYRDGELTPVPVAAGENIPAGVIVCINSDGYAVNGKEAADLRYAGCSDEAVDNRAGADGDLFILVRMNKAFLWDNDGTVTQECLGQRVYILDNQTVTASGGGASAVMMAQESVADGDGAAGSKKAKKAALDAVTPPAEDDVATRSRAGTVILIDADGVWVY
ncbi:hypothetical protein M942_04510 [Enterobacter ludwigii]|jgi:hypothetical protein|uniref:hypothetical protein n=1 Tax=Enterobacter ludwigii TaxID=299767 RepID=UPI0003D8F189|nr:hypothetical protein [Enterobacter ludwigii]AHE69221.1 hypothetical protein M942_04510 [Enterobacter ludwigii]